MTHVRRTHEWRGENDTPREKGSPLKTTEAEPGPVQVRSRCMTPRWALCKCCGAKCQSGSTGGSDLEGRNIRGLTRLGDRHSTKVRGHNEYWTRTAPGSSSEERRNQRRCQRAGRECPGGVSSDRPAARLIRPSRTAFRIINGRICGQGKAETVQEKFTPVPPGAFFTLIVKPDVDTLVTDIVPKSLVGILVKAIRISAALGAKSRARLKLTATDVDAALIVPLPSLWVATPKLSRTVEKLLFVAPMATVLGLGLRLNRLLGG